MLVFQLLISDIVVKTLYIAPKNNPDIYQVDYLCMYGHHIYQEKDQPGKVANPARGQLTREIVFFPVSVRA